MKVKFFFLVVIMLIVLGMSISLSGAKINPESAVAVWLLDEGKGNTAKDSSDTGNDGKLINGPKWVDGPFGKALKFVGGDSVDVPDVDSLNFGEKSFTVVTWFNFSAAQDWNRLVRERNPSPWGSGNYGWELQTQGILIHWSLDDSAGNHQKTNYAAVGDGEWHHTAMIVDRGKKQMITYLDGGDEKKADIATIKSVTDALPVTIGGGFNGSIDEVAIFNETLTVDDINNIMKNGLEATVDAASVEPVDKLATTWGTLKARR